MMAPYMEYFPAVPTVDTLYRVLLTANVQSGTFQFHNLVEMRFEDVGNFPAFNGGVILGSGTGGGSGTQTYTTNFGPLNTYSYYGNDAVGGAANTIRAAGVTFWHGGEPDSGGSYNGTQYTFMSYSGDPQSIQSTLSGATINWVKLFLYNQHSWWNSGMYVTVGYNSNSHIGNPNSGRTDVLVNGGSNDYFHVSEGGWGSCSLPTSVGSAFASGAAKSIQLGPGTPNMSYNNYGYFAGTQTSAGPYLQVNYSK